MMRIFYLIVLLVLLMVADLVTKYLVSENIPPDTYVPIIWEFLWIERAYNSGIAFSLPLEGIPLQVLTIALIAAIIYFYVQDEYKKKSHLLDIAYILILAWAFSHAYERIFIWHVIDFIFVKYFAILNFADIFISVGVFMLAIHYLSHEYHRKFRS